MQRQIQTTCFESIFIDNAFQTTRELENEKLVHCNVWNSSTPSQEPCAKSQISLNRLNQHSLLGYSKVLELVQTMDKVIQPIVKT